MLFVVGVFTNHLIIKNKIMGSKQKDINKYSVSIPTDIQVGKMRSSYIHKTCLKNELH